jgi:hypothetical protein
VDRNAGGCRAVIKFGRAKLQLCPAARQHSPTKQRFQICEEIIIAQRRGSAKLLANLTKEKL